LNDESDENGKNLSSYFIDEVNAIPTIIQFINDQYSDLSDMFLKGSYAKMVDSLNRILNPKKSGGSSNNDDDDDNDDDNSLETFKTLVKTYDPNIRETLSNFDVYMKVIESHSNCSADADAKCNEIIISHFYSKNVPVFSLFDDTLSLWFLPKGSQFLIDNDMYMNITLEHCMGLITTKQLKLNSTHYTTLDTVKRDYISGSLDLMSTHLKMLSNMFYYRGIYKAVDSFSQLSDLQLRNTINGFPNGFDDDVAKNCLAIFQLNRLNENKNDDSEMELRSYWITKCPIQNIIGCSDYEAFTWAQIDMNELMDCLSAHSKDISIGTSCLH